MVSAVTPNLSFHRPGVDWTMRPKDPLSSPGLGDFILSHMEEILQAWEDFARSIWPGEPAEVVVLRNDASAMLTAVVKDMASQQSLGQQVEKSQGHGSGETGTAMDSTAVHHAQARVESGFDIGKLVAEFRAIRASVNKIWTESCPATGRAQVDEMVRFNEAIDQLVAASVQAFSERIDRGRRIFLGIIGHDMRQPLQTLNLLVEMLGHSEGGQASSQIEPVRNQMRGATSQLTALLSDLLDFNTAQVGSAMQIRRELANLQSIAEQLVFGYRIAHPAMDFKIRVSGDLHGDWDITRMRQLLTNLVSNAVAHGSGESVFLTLQGDEDRVVIEVRNWGSPIPAEALPNLFNPMVRLSREEVHRAQGSVGLGLYICREIARAHDGSIQVESSEAGGTAFIVDVARRAKVEEI
jgi:signal transduction histidine kinase